MVELMVSISIIAIVMVFLVKMLIDARYDVTNELYDTEDQVTRAEIIKTIENDLDGKNITSIDHSGSNANKLQINIHVGSETGVITSQKTNEKECLFYSSASIQKKWCLKTKNTDTYIQKTNIPYRVIKNVNKDYIITINIPIIVDEIKKQNDSQMDNIMLTFYGNSDISETNEGSTLN